MERRKLTRTSRISSEENSCDLAVKPDWKERLLPDGWKSVQVQVTKKNNSQASKIVIEAPDGTRFKTPKSLRTYIEKKKLPLNPEEFSWSLHPWAILEHPPKNVETPTVNPNHLNSFNDSVSSDI